MTPTQKKVQQAVLSAAHHDYKNALGAHALRKVRDASVSEDLVQDTFMKTWSYLVKGGKIDVMKAFLYHVLNQLIVDTYRKQSAISLEVLLEKGFEPSIDQSEHQTNVLDGKTTLLLIQRLPEKYQKVMRMRYVHDLSLQEMSIITGQSKNALAVQIHRGLKKLQELYNST